MITESINDIKVNVTGGELKSEEISAYIKHAKGKFSGRTIKAMDIKVDGDYVDIDYTLEPIKFERIRRITGYLVGTTDRFNNAKRAEESQRVKHSLDGIMEKIWKFTGSVTLLTKLYRNRKALQNFIVNFQIEYKNYFEPLKADTTIKNRENRITKPILRC